MEKDTPFRQTKHETLFKNVANVTLKGTTFNATHMDKFLTSGYGEHTYQSAVESKVSPIDKNTGRTTGPGGGGGSNIMSYLSSSSQIRPSYSFMGLTREEQKQDKYVDMNSGPSPMQIVGNERAFKDKFGDRKVYYESEREKHLINMQNSVEELKEAKRSLYKPLEKN
jgi:hypothetical protein